MKKETKNRAIGLMALIAVSHILSQSTLSSELQKPPTMSIEEKRVVGQVPELNPKWTWMTANHAIHILKSAGYSFVHPLQKNKAHWQGIVTKNNGQPSPFVDINRYGEISTFMGSDIIQRWPKFSSEDVLAFKDREDLIELIHIKYGISSAIAEREVEIFLMGSDYTYNLIDY